MRTWYIRHEVVCEDGVDVRTFMKQQAAVDDATVIKTLEQVCPALNAALPGTLHCLERCIALNAALP